MSDTASARRAAVALAAASACVPPVALRCTAQRRAGAMAPARRSTPLSASDGAVDGGGDGGAGGWARRRPAPAPREPPSGSGAPSQVSSTFSRPLVGALRHPHARRVTATAASAYGRRTSPGPAGHLGRGRRRPRSNPAAPVAASSTRLCGRRRLEGGTSEQPSWRRPRRALCPSHHRGGRASAATGAELRRVLTGRPMSGGGPAGASTGPGIRLSQRCGDLRGRSARPWSGRASYAVAPIGAAPLGRGCAVRIVPPPGSSWWHDTVAPPPPPPRAPRRRALAPRGPAGRHRGRAGDRRRRAGCLSRPRGAAGRVSGPTIDGQAAPFDAPTRRKLASYGRASTRSPSSCPRRSSRSPPRGPWRLRGPTSCGCA